MDRHGCKNELTFRWMDADGWIDGWFGGMKLVVYNLLLVILRE